MKYVLILLLAVAFGNTSAQRIHFTDISNKWTYLNMDRSTNGAGNLHTEVSLAEYSFDTIIAGTRYHCLYASKHYWGNLALREDTIVGKIYFRFIDGAANRDTIEHVFFNYNLVKGDTFTIDTKTSIVEVVDSVGTVSLGGMSYRKWRMKPVSAHKVAYTFIEGMGTLVTPFWNVENDLGIGEYYAELRCFTSGGVQPLCSPRQMMLNTIQGNSPPYDIVPVAWFDNDTSCILKTLDVVNVGNFGTPIISPNPGGDDLTLTLTTNTSAAFLEVRDFTGRVVLSKAVSGSKITIGKFLSTPGIYSYTIQDAANRRYNGKFIFQ